MWKDFFWGTWTRVRDVWKASPIAAIAIFAAGVIAGALVF